MHFKISDNNFLAKSFCHT